VPKDKERADKRHVIYLRIRSDLRDKLRRMVSAELMNGDDEASMNSVVTELIESAKDPVLDG